MFINFLANALSTAINKVEMQIDDKTVECLSHSTVRNTGKTVIGSIQTGQKQNVLLKVKTKHNMTPEIKFIYNDKQVVHKIDLNQSLQSENLQRDSFFAIQYFKNMLLGIISEGLNSSPSSLSSVCQKLDQFYERVEDFLNHHSDSSHPFLQIYLESLLLNVKSGEVIQGQIYKAFSKEEW